MAGILRLSDSAGEERVPERPDFVSVEIAHRVAQLFRRRSPAAGSAVPRELVEDAVIDEIASHQSLIFNHLESRILNPYRDPRMRADSRRDRSGD